MCLLDELHENLQLTERFIKGRNVKFSIIGAECLTRVNFLLDLFHKSCPKLRKRNCRN